MRARAFAVGAALAVLGCGASDAGPTQNLEVFSWWVNPGDSSALEALIASFEQGHPRIKVVRSNPSTPAAAAAQANARVVSGSAPDVFQTFGGAEVSRYTLRNGKDDTDSLLESLNEPARAGGLINALPAFVRSSLSYQDNLYAIPLDIPRFNVLFYNKRVLANNSLSPPTTLEELHAVAAALSPKGIVPLALGARNGAVISQLLFDAVLISKSGVAFRDSYLAGKENPSDARIADALAEVSLLLASSNTNRHQIDWTVAARSVIEGSAAMTLVGDWAKAFFVNAGMKPDVDFGEIAFPGTQSVFVYATDAFSVSRGIQNRTAALEFASFLATRETADLFARTMGTSAARLDADRSSLDPIARRTLDVLSSSTVTRACVALLENLDAVADMDETLSGFSQNGDADAVLNMLRSRYDQF